ncbi:hypothetical protein ACHAXT_003694 [Thalassiosira profunda]
MRDDHGPIRAVVFDRFYAEEAYSFRIRELCPDAVLVLDMQDVHSLRAGRRCLVEEMDEQSPTGIDDQKGSFNRDLMEQVMAFDPATHLGDDRSKAGAKAHDMFLRELASVHRSDLVLVCSSAEMKLLESWNVPKWKLVPASFFCMEEDSPVGGDGRSIHTFEDRDDFVSVGGFKHAPNVDSAKVLRHELWPRIREQLPEARMHVYGAYPTQEILSLHQAELGFLVHGHVDELDRALLQSRVLLAPLRFGAGIKGKIVDAWRCGCPVVTTPVGAEGMLDDDEPSSIWSIHQRSENTNWGGMVASDADQFVDAAVEAYTRKDLWLRCRDEGTRLLRRLFNGKASLPIVETGILDTASNLRRRRQLDYVGAMLWRDSQRSTDYFSRWIELKERLGPQA